MEMSFALPVQVLLAQISVPALENRRQQPEFVFFSQRGHLGASIVELWMVAGNRPTLNSQRGTINLFSPKGATTAFTPSATSVFLSSRAAQTARDLTPANYVTQYKSRADSGERVM
jgi:hypothetical protein